LREFFFGKSASTEWNTTRLINLYSKNFTALSLDIRRYDKLESIFKDVNFEIIIHAAAQPSHDWAAKDPQTDFSINASGTLNLLELTRNYSPKATFIFTSTNKVYGDNPNKLPLLELSTRYEIADDHIFWRGIDESMSIDHTTHSIFGVSKTSADLLVQEYSRYFGLKTGVFRGGCLTGPMHSSAELHGFLAYLVKCIVHQTPYTIFGYKGKQVRDNIHSKDLIQMFMEFHNGSSEKSVYNAGGGRANSISILEAIERISYAANKEPMINLKEENRIGDHKWYITDFGEFQKDFPSWRITYSIDNLIEEMVQAAQDTL